MTQVRCALCEAEMSCTPEGGCWCMQLPPVMALPTGESAGCFCPSCLRGAMAAALGQAGDPDRIAGVGDLHGQTDNFETLPKGS
jgi:hypothetical protein